MLVNKMFHCIISRYTNTILITAGTGTQPRATTWSSCTARIFEKNLKGGYGSCLKWSRNKLEEPPNMSKCGNLWVDPGQSILFPSSQQVRNLLMSILEKLNKSIMTAKTLQSQFYTKLQ